jgi:hypothetical protein
MKNSILLILILIGGSCLAQSKKKPANKKPVFEHVTVAGKSAGALSKEELINAEGLYYSNGYFHITGFKMTLVNAKGKKAEYVNGANAKLTPVMRTGIKDEMNLKKVLFENIKCADKDNYVKALPSMSFTIK